MMRTQQHEFFRLPHGVLRPLASAVGLALLLACAGGPKGKDSAAPAAMVHEEIVLHDLTALRLVFEIELSTPPSETIRALETDWRLEAGGGRIAGDRRRIELVTRGPGGRAARLEIPLTYLELERGVANFARVSEIPYVFAGTVRVPGAAGAVEAPFEHKGRIPIARAPGVALAGIKPGSFGLRNIDLNAEAEVTNPNAFEIGTDSVIFKLKVGRIEAADLLPVESVTIAPGQTAAVRVSGEVSAGGAARQFLSGNLPGGTNLVPAGHLDTPYGRVDLTPPELPYVSPPDSSRR